MTIAWHRLSTGGHIGTVIGGTVADGVTDRMMTIMDLTAMKNFPSSCRFSGPNAQSIGTVITMNVVTTAIGGVTAVVVVADR
jgi:hypothetical protein